MRKSRKNSKKGRGSNASQTEASDMYTLDTDLDHMEGIVNPIYGAPLSGSTMTSSLDSRASNWSDSISSGTRPNGSEASSTGMPFTNPFVSGTQSPDGQKGANGAHPFPSTLPRRPSHLRTVVATPTEEGVNPFDILPLAAASTFPGGGASGSGSGGGDKTTFSNPFASAAAGAIPSQRAPHLNLNLSGLDPSLHSPLSTPQGPSALAPASPAAGAVVANPIVSVAPPIRPQEKAWIAPESWGVEGDLPEDDQESSGEDAEGPSIELLDTLNSAGGQRLLRPPPTPGVEVDEFNWAATDSGSAGSRPVTGGSIAGRSMRQSTVSMGRPSTAGARPGTGNRSKAGSASAASSTPVSGGSTRARPTAGHLADSPHPAQVFLRVYRSDGSHTTIACALNSTTSDIIAILSVKNLQPKGGYRLYIRERRTGTCAPSLRQHLTVGRLLTHPVDCLPPPPRQTARSTLERSRR